jgi:serine/threonine protein kinase/WD40 repeat protein
MSGARKCPNCGTPVPPNAPSGHCPACLLRIGLALSDGGLAFELTEPMPTAPAAAVAQPDPSIGERIRYLGDYELLEVIAHGGMGVVYKARQVSLNRLVALKLIRAGELANASEIARFRAEAEAGASLDHPNIAPIYEVGEHEGRHYFSMKLIAGSPLSAAIAAGCWCRTPCPAHRPPGFFLPNRAGCCPTAARLVATVARGVHYAHQRGILHRDLKPGNILLDAQGQPHVTDFGLAKRIEADSGMTLSGAILGTPSYIAPEQAAGIKALTTAADVYGLGAILYELLTGRPPFRGASALDTLLQVREQIPKPPRAIHPSVNRDLETICLKCLEKDPARRYGTAEALAEDLERWLEHRPIRARPTTPAERMLKWMRRKPALAAAVVGLHLVAVLGLAGILWQWREAVSARQTAETATREKQEQVERLWQSQFISARHYRTTGAIGQRTNSLAVIAAATAIRPSLDLRNEAIAALLLPDLGTPINWKQQPDFFHPWCYDPDLEHYLPHVEQGRVRVLHALDHQIVADLGEAPAQSNTAVFSPDGRFVAVMFDDGRVRVWEWRAGRLAGEVHCYNRVWAVRPYDFSPDSRSLLYGDETHGVSRLQLDTGAIEPLVKTQPVGLVRVSPSGRLLAVGRNTGTEVWDLSDNRRLATTNFPGGKPFFLGLAWHPNEAALAIGADQALFLWPWRDGEWVRLGGAGLYHFAPFFNATGDRLYSGAGVWDVATQMRVLHFGAGLGMIALSHDERRIAGQSGKTGFGLWEYHPPEVLRKFVTLAQPPMVARTLDLHPNGRWLLSGSEGGWTLWDVDLARPVARDPEPDSHPPEVVSAVKFSRDGRAFHTCDHRGLRRWPLRESRISNLKSQITVGEPETLLAGLPAAGAIDTNLPLAQQILALAQAADTECRAGLFAVDGRSVALVGNGQAVLFSLEPRALFPFVRLLHPHDNIPALSPDGRWLATTHNNQHGGPDVYDLHAGRHAVRLAKAELSGIAWRPQTGELVTVSTVEALFWEPGSWVMNRRFPWPNPGLGIGLAGFSPDGRTGWLNGTDGAVQFVDLKGGQLYVTLPPWTAEPHHVGAIAFDVPRQRAYLAHVSGVLALDIGKLRRELARLGLDWPEAQPGEGFAPRHAAPP